MRRLLAIATVTVALAGCEAGTTLSLAPGFYPSAVAHDPVHDRFFVASYATGAVVILRRDGLRVASVRAPGAAAPVVQLAYDATARRLWTLTPDAVELIDLDATPTRRIAVAAVGASGRFVDLVTSGGRAFVLNAAEREVIEIATSRRSARIVARLPHGPEHAPEAGAAQQCAGAPGLDDGALLALPDRSALVVALDGGLWRIDLRTGAVEGVSLATPLPHVSQLVLLAADGVALHVAALRGRANEAITLRLAPDARHAAVDAGTRRRFDTPLRGAQDGRDVVVLLGRLRHHPSFCGDGRPNLPPRFATYAPLAARADVAIASSPPGAPRAR